MPGHIIEGSCQRRGVAAKGANPQLFRNQPQNAECLFQRERIFIELMTSDRKLKASIEGSR